MRGCSSRHGPPWASPREPAQARQGVVEDQGRGRRIERAGRRHPPGLAAPAAVAFAVTKVAADGSATRKTGRAVESAGVAIGLPPRDVATAAGNAWFGVADDASAERRDREGVVTPIGLVAEAVLPPTSLMVTWIV